jgi:hypothetical protein
VDRHALERARRRIVEAHQRGPSGADVEAALERAQAGLDALAQTTAELEASVHDRLGAAVQEGMRAEVLPVARHIAEVRGLTTQVVRRLDALGAEVSAERRERVEDLALLVDLVASGWRSVERRLDRLERVADRIERVLEERPGAALYPLEGGAEMRPGA